MARKTTDIAELTKRVNSMLAAPGSTHEGRVALCVLLSSVLLDAEQYRGFQFINEDGTTRTVGITGLDPDDPGHSRRRYYV